MWEIDFELMKKVNKTGKCPINKKLKCPCKKFVEDYVCDAMLYLWLSEGYEDDYNHIPQNIHNIFNKEEEILVFRGGKNE